eukprot:gene672-10378_t
MAAGQELPKDARRISRKTVPWSHEYLSPWSNEYLSPWSNEYLDILYQIKVGFANAIPCSSLLSMQENSFGGPKHDVESGVTFSL